ASSSGSSARASRSAAVKVASSASFVVILSSPGRAPPGLLIPAWPALRIRATCSGGHVPLSNTCRSRPAPATAARSGTTRRGHVRPTRGVHVVGRDEQALMAGFHLGGVSVEEEERRGTRDPATAHHVHRGPHAQLPARTRQVAEGDRHVVGGEVTFGLFPVARARARVS